MFMVTCGAGHAMVPRGMREHRPAGRIGVGLHRLGELMDNTDEPNGVIPLGTADMQ